MQTGHMHKEARNFPVAEERYLQALSCEPENAEILLQLGHFYKIVGRYHDAAYYYLRATIFAPDWENPRIELQRLRATHEWEKETEREHTRAEQHLLAHHGDSSGQAYGSLIDPELFVKSPEELHIEHQNSFVFTRNGFDQITRWGRGLTVRGVDCLRGYIIADTPCLEIEIFLDGKRIYKSDLASAPLRKEKKNPDLKKYVYNAWIDFTAMPRGCHDLIFRAVNILGDMKEGVNWRRERVIVADPLDPALCHSSDGFVPQLDPASPLSVIEQINALPSVIHRSSTCSLPFKLKHVAILRPDQLGDMVISVPSLLRLRELFPDVKITGLLSAANEGLARSLNIFDDIVIIDFPDNPQQGSRVMQRHEQEALIRQCAPYNFDLVIDLPVAGNSFRLLPLLDSSMAMGFGTAPKTIGMNVLSHDPCTYNDFMHNSARTRMLIEALGLCLDSGAKVVRRDDLSRNMLARYGVPEGRDYVVLHTGARLKFTQWPYYAELARRIVEDLDMVVVYMAENEDQKALLPPEMLTNGHIIYSGQTLPFDDFDAFLSFASVFVGNDSGPKHLAALRGTPVISIHSARIGWSEWGQEQTGVIISRRVPCADCALHHEPEECAHDIACIKHITVAEVFEEVEKLI
ncbi:lipopolysaccharide core biosynthesis protein [Komagataeibacter europaeus]|uniref:Lipopolysaccharide core biosynthesis protein n=1 Tax=Komagataeibacter europaeus TaxID=33995 RepID=A0A0M0EG75_KOMEU|nr:lipopolysaccharide core biosynthesis protein [Komagataeibacter europaeus]